MKRKLALLTLAGALSVPMVAAEFITIGTGSVTGTYYPTGGAICQMVNKNKKETNIRCSVESTGGSVYNVNTIKAGELDFGISQSDTAYQAFKGEGKFQGAAAVPELRSAIAIYPELLALVVSQKSGIKSITDLKGKKINLDSPGSGTHMTADLVFEAFGIKASDLALANELKVSEGPTMLQDNHIDGYFFVAGHPTANIKDAANSVDISIVPIDGPQIDVLLKKYPYYAKGIISGSYYKGVPNDVPSIGVKAVLVTSTKVKDEVVYQVVKTILDNFEKFKELHPSYKTITKESLLEGLSIPQHPGAIRAFKEAGILK
ncbi:TAXI family TRAP transporter solute-binding subunit [Sulfurospirillum deleyianum]|uniref:TRAP transporter solute receptor, TAXI family n=1 Tax=Sulfurospirillum deleyianum (strain ATCC 51133 / DSM 6946 / 5175) TaxID=525898 RepID=D1B0N2_SULD5|nr:TAXI family TRAP transporter solute-binding subunit [Sulfurospirillum deleyianum]ACZ11351.1 TRAP transporter solute receptor, TAXI family [Sulfurospirillum deleyianum DSM 6946]